MCGSVCVDHCLLLVVVPFTAWVLGQSSVPTPTISRRTRIETAQQQLQQRVVQTAIDLAAVTGTSVYCRFISRTVQQSRQCLPRASAGRESSVTSHVSNVTLYRQMGQTTCTCHSRETCGSTVGEKKVKGSDDWTKRPVWAAPQNLVLPRLEGIKTCPTGIYTPLTHLQ